MARGACPIIEQSNIDYNPSTYYEMGPRMWEHLEIVLNRHEIGVSQDIKCTLQTYDHLFPGATAEIAPPHRGRALSVSWLIGKHRTPLLAYTMNPFSLPVRSPSSCPNSPSRLFAQPASPTPTALTSATAFAMGRRTSSTVSGFSDLPAWSILLDPKASHCLLQAGNGTEEELLRIVTCSHSNPTHAQELLL
jgi:hypothetical protein